MNLLPIVAPQNFTESTYLVQLNARLLIVFFEFLDGAAEYKKAERNAAKEIHSWPYFLPKLKFVLIFPFK